MPEDRPDFIQLIDLLDADITEVRRLSQVEGVDRSSEVASLEADRDRLIRSFFGQLTPWDEVRLARHPRRPYTLDYLNGAFDDFLELHGDRLGADDPAIVGGLGWIGGYPVITFGHQKGRDIKQRQLRNFGSAKPEGFRKALRLLRLAEKLHKPVVCIVDTPAADCSVEAEERGISEAIARNLMEMFRIRTPIVVVITGEGGSGGALAIGVGDRILMLEHAIYSVIPPEGCAAILWRDPSRKVEAAEALQLTAKEALRHGLIDEVVPEPFGAAHRDPESAAQTLREAILRALEQVTAEGMDGLLDRRFSKFRAMGDWLDPESVSEQLQARSRKNGRKKKDAADDSSLPAGNGHQTKEPGVRT